MTDPVTPTAIPDLGTTFPDASDLDTFDTRAAALFSYLVGTLQPGANTLGEQAYTNALAAQEAAISAYLNANYRGAWSSLTGPLTVPSLVSHAGERWVLLSDLADVTTSTPGVGVEWELFELPQALGVGFDPTGTSLVATNVQDALEAVSAAADEGVIEFENPILNGRMRVAQVATSFAVTTGTTHLIDGWKYAANSTSALTISQVSGTTPDNPRAKWLQAQVTTADASIAASDYSYIFQIIEGYEASKYIGKTFALSFWVKSSVTGVHSVLLQGTPPTKSYIGTVNIAVANTPQFATITLVGGLPDEATWNSDIGAGLYLYFGLAVGSNFHGAAGSWLTGNYSAVAAQVNVLGTIGNIFAITDVQINPGSVAKRRKLKSFADELLMCQRYYKEVGLSMSGYGIAGSTCKQTLTISPTIRTGGVVTTTIFPDPFANCTANSSALLTAGPGSQFINGVVGSVNVTATGNYSNSGKIIINARL